MCFYLAMLEVHYWVNNLVTVAICCCATMRNTFFTLSHIYSIMNNSGENIIRQNSEISAEV